MRELIGSFLILIVALALTLFGIGYGYPGHPYAVGSVMIFAACYLYYLFERVYVKPDMLERAKRDGERMVRAMLAREILGHVGISAGIGYVAAYLFAFAALVLSGGSLKTFNIVLGVSIVLVFTVSVVVLRLKRNSQRPSLG